MAEEGFSRNTEKQRTAEGREGFEAREQREVVRGRFPKTDSWIEGDAHWVEAGRYRSLEGVSKKFPDLRDYIAVGRSRLHRSRRSLHMHDHNPGAELGLRYASRIPGEYELTLVAFRNQLTDLIDYDPADNYKTFNIAKARTQGVELGGGARPIKGLRVFGAATLLDTEVLSPDYQGIAVAGQSLLRRPRCVLHVGAELTPDDDWTFGGAVSWLHGRVDFDWNLGQRVDLPDATTVRLWVRRALGHGGELTLRLENLTNESTPPTGIGFGAQPRSVYVGYTRRF